MSMKFTMSVALVLSLMAIGMGAMAQSDPNYLEIASGLNVNSCVGTGSLSGNPSGPTGWSAPSPGSCDTSGFCVWSYVGSTTYSVSWTAPAGKCADKVVAYIRVKPAVILPSCTGGTCPGASGTFGGPFYTITNLHNCPC